MNINCGFSGVKGYFLFFKEEIKQANLDDFKVWVKPES